MAAVFESHAQFLKINSAFFLCSRITCRSKASRLPSPDTEPTLFAGSITIIVTVIHAYCCQTPKPHQLARMLNVVAVNSLTDVFGFFSACHPKGEWLIIVRLSLYF